MKILFAFVGLAFLALSGCTATLSPVVSSASVGGKNEVPLGIAKGQSEANYFLGIRAGGDDSVDAAIENALKGSLAHTLSNIVIDRDVFCFPACPFAIYRDVVTHVRGVSVRYRLDNGEWLPNDSQGNPPPANAAPGVM